MITDIPTTLRHVERAITAYDLQTGQRADIPVGAQIEGVVYSLHSNRWYFRATVNGQETACYSYDQPHTRETL